MSTKISVVTVCFNSEGTIAQTMESVLSQSLPPFEYIIIDGVSTDGTMTVVNFYREAFEAKGIRLRGDLRCHEQGLRAGHGRGYGDS